MFTNTDMYSKIYKQNNFTNLHLSTFGNQLVRIEEQIAQIGEDIKNIKPKEKKQESETFPTNIRPPVLITKFNLSNPKKNSELLEELGKRLKGLSIDAISEELEPEINNQEILEMEKSFLQSQKSRILHL